jgi:hypothetical protein
MAERRTGADDPQLAQVIVAHLGDAPEPWLAAGRALAWRQAEEGGELAPAGEGAGVLIVATVAEAVTGPTPGMVINRLAVSSALTAVAISLSIAPIASSSRRSGRQADEARRARNREPRSRHPR